MRTGNRIAALSGAVLVAVVGMVGLGAAGAASAADANACNDYGAVLAGEGMECTVTVDNYVNGVDEYSTVTVKECHGAANTVLLAPACTTTVIIMPELTLSVTQCNGTLNGGGSNVTCSVQVNNHLSGPATPALVTFDQCMGSGGGGVSPVGDPLNCAPPGNTTTATVTQCNGSVNGGGAPQRVNCDVTAGSETALPVLVNQCNGTVNSGGSLLFCHAEFTNEYGVTNLPTTPTGASTTLVTTTTGGTFGTGTGPVFALPVLPALVVQANAVGGVTVSAAAAAAAARRLALSGSETAPIAGTALLMIALGALAIGFAARRAQRPGHRLG
jgi:hypothetical protein